MDEKQMQHGSIKFEPNEKGFWEAAVTFNNKEEKLPLGSILLGVIAENEEIRENFINLMRKTFEYMLTEVEPENELIFSYLKKKPSVNH